ncbi:MAG: hypothetical protein ACYTFZ_05900 [Planctomycetota bacterium]|jgi:hypothetical protein
MSAQLQWVETLRQMERYTRTEWSGGMTVFAVEGTARSALK